jgi:predicted nuclease with TOPRIM domain
MSQDYGFMPKPKWTAKDYIATIVIVVVSALLVFAEIKFGSSNDDPVETDEERIEELEDENDELEYDNEELEEENEALQDYIDELETEEE